MNEEDSEDSRMDTNSQPEQNLFPKKLDPQDQSISALFQRIEHIEKKLSDTKGNVSETENLTKNLTKDIESLKRNKVNIEEKKNLENSIKELKQKDIVNLRDLMMTILLALFGVTITMFLSLNLRIDNIGGQVNGIYQLLPNELKQHLQLKKSNKDTLAPP